MEDSHSLPLVVDCVERSNQTVSEDEGFTRDDELHVLATHQTVDEDEGVSGEGVADGAVGGVA